MTQVASTGNLSLRRIKIVTEFSVKGDGFSSGKIAARKWEHEVNMRRGESLLTSLHAGVRLHPSRRLRLASAPPTPNKSGRRLFAAAIAGRAVRIARGALQRQIERRPTDVLPGDFGELGKTTGAGTNEAHGPSVE